jgi:hypothetical protein
VIRLDLTDFSGGLLEAQSPGDFTERQNAVVKGFVLEDEVRLRTQGPVQRVGSLTGVVAVRSFRGTSNKYLVAITSDGGVHWAVAPSRTATNTTTSSLSFTEFTITKNSNFRFTTETRVKVSNEYRQALLVHSLSGTAPGLLIYENGSALTYQAISDFYPTLTKKVSVVLITNGGEDYVTPPTVAFSGGGGSGATGTAIIASGKVTAVVVTAGGTGYTSAPTVSFTDGGGTGATAIVTLEEFGVPGKLPRHNVACMWKDTLLLADIEWSAANTANLTVSNTQRYRNFAWHALDGTDLTLFDPRYPARIAEEGATVVGMQEVPEGLLVLTTTTTGVAGLIMLRGGPTDYRVETLRPGLGLLSTTATWQRQSVHCWWNEVGSTIFVDALGKVYQVRGTQVDRIDRYGAEAPEAGTDGDQVAAIGQWLFLSRAGRLLVLRSFGAEGAWTELVTPGQVSSMNALEDCLYFVADSKLWRYCIEGPAAERGRVGGSYVDLEFGTRTMGNPQENLDKWWSGLTVRAQGITSGVLKSVVLLAGGVLTSPTPASATFTLNHALGARELVSVPGLGPSVECAARLVFTGDLRLENLSFEVDGGDDQL